MIRHQSCQSKPGVAKQITSSYVKAGVNDARLKFRPAMAFQKVLSVPGLTGHRQPRSCNKDGLALRRTVDHLRFDRNQPGPVPAKLAGKGQQNEIGILRTFQRLVEPSMDLVGLLAVARGIKPDHQIGLVKGCRQCVLHRNEHGNSPVEV